MATSYPLKVTLVENQGQDHLPNGAGSSPKDSALSPTRLSPMDKVAAKAQDRMWTCGCGSWQVGSWDRVAQLPVHGDWVVPGSQASTVRVTGTLMQA